MFSFTKCEFFSELDVCRVVFVCGNALEISRKSSVS